MPWEDDWKLDRFGAIADAEELCRRLLASSGGWGSSTRHIEAVELLERVAGTSELPGSFVALMVCACRRWDRVTARLIAAIEDAGLLESADLDELADAFLSHEHVISYPLTWVSPQWLEVELDSGTGRTYTVDEDTLARHRPSFEPPLRRWAARRVLRADPARLDDLLRSARAFEPRHRDALVHGLLDAAQGSTTHVSEISSDADWRAPRRACAAPRSTGYANSTAPRSRLAEPGRTPYAAVRNWRPREAELTTLSLLGS